MFDTRDKPQMVERAFLIGAYFDRGEEEEAQNLLRELEELVTTLGIGIVATRCVFVRDRNKRYLTGSGKAAELIAEATAHEADCIVFDNELLPSPQRTWEEFLRRLIEKRSFSIVSKCVRRRKKRAYRLSLLACSILCLVSPACGATLIVSVVQ